MSRILRRPMFRGGRVDSRGTGITSGLNYAKGGSVNTPKRGLVDGPGGYGGGMGTGGYYDSLLGKGIRSVRDYVGKPFLNFINQDIANPILSLGGYGDFFERMETPWDDKYLLGLDENYDKIPSDEYVPYSARYSNKGKGPIETDSGAIPKAIQQQEEIIKLEELKALELKRKEEAEQALAAGLLDSKKTKKETIDEYKEIFKDAYGSGVADDASNMLLSFAGKALKPEATVKSAFGEFFEEEGKRPSDRKKYKDAATTAAINAFLTGEKTMAETEAFMTKTNWQLNQQAALKKAGNDPSNLDWTDRRTYYMTSIKGSNRDSDKVIKMSLQDEKSEQGKQIFETKETEWITNPAEAAEMDDGLYIVSPNKGSKRIIEIKDGRVLDRSNDFPL